MTPLYIFDLDGTLALIEHRRHFLVVGPCQVCQGDGRHGWIENDVMVYIDKPCPACKGARERSEPDWRTFFAACVKDAPNWPVIGTMMALLKAGADVRIWSGRSAEVMNETLTWLHRWICGDEIDADELQLMMRREGDHTPDEQLKAGWYDQLSEYDRKRLVAVFDDRDKVVSMWRAKGVSCFQVAPGSF